MTKEEILKIIRYRKGNHGLTRIDTDLRKDFFTTKARRHEEFLATEGTENTELGRVLSAVCPRKNLLKKASFYHKF